MSDADIALANHADADEMAAWAVAHAEELAARDRAALLIFPAASDPTRTPAATACSTGLCAVRAQAH
jgi:hypothetical protein